jgi:MFS family permease
MAHSFVLSIPAIRLEDVSTKASAGVHNLSTGNITTRVRSYFAIRIRRRHRRRTAYVRSQNELALLKTMQSGVWIGPRPSVRQMVAIVFVGTIGILIPGVQPIVLGALLTEQHITLSQLGHAASVELLSMGLAAALAAALLPPRRLREICVAASLLLALGNYFTPLAMGETVTALRAITGAAGGLLIWVAASMIARSAAPDRWAGIYLTVQTLAQFIFAALMTSWIDPQHATRGDFGMLAIAGLICAAASFALPAAFQALPKGEGTGHFVMPPPRGLAALASNFLLLMFIVGIWVYYDPIARQAGLSTQISDTAVSISLAFQVLGGTAATVFAGRLKWFPVFVFCAAVDFVMVALLGTQPSAALFLVDAAVFGFIWLFMLPFLVPMLIEADPSRRSAVLTSGVSLLGASAGPSVVGLIVSPDDTRGALWLGAVCLLLSLLIAAALRFTRNGSGSRP